MADLGASRLSSAGGSSGASLSDAVPDAITTDQAGAAGTGASASRDDHAHAIVAEAPVTQAFADVAAEGTSANFARGDHKHGMPVEPRRSVWVQAHAIEGTATLASVIGNYGAALLGSATAQGIADIAGFIPSDFNTLRSAKVYFMTTATGDLRYFVNTSYAAVGELHNANSGTIATTTLAVATALQMSSIDISSTLAALAGNDVFGVQFGRAGADALDTLTDFYFIGLVIEYD